MTGLLVLIFWVQNLARFYFLGWQIFELFFWVSLNFRYFSGSHRFPATSGSSLTVCILGNSIFFGSWKLFSDEHPCRRNARVPPPPWDESLPAHILSSSPPDLVDSIPYPIFNISYKLFITQYFQIIAQYFSIDHSQYYDISNHTQYLKSIIVFLIKNKHFCIQQNWVLFSISCFGKTRNICVLPFPFKIYRDPWQ